MSLVKKITSVVASLAIVFSIVSPIIGVNAAYTSLEAANKLATLGVIVDNSSNPSDYRLGDTITRREMLKVMMKLSSVTVEDNCEGKFADLPTSDWGCKYAEAALASGMLAANANFRPNDNVSKIEALKMVMKARSMEKGSAIDWREAYVDAAVEAGILTAAFTDYDTTAERGWIFTASVNAIESDEVAMDEEDDLLGDLLGDLDDDTTDTTDTTDDTTDTTDDTVVSSDNVLTVSLSPDTPAAATVPGSISGLPVAKFDVTAGSEDVTISSLVLRRRGLSDKDTLTALAAFTSEGRVSKAKNDSQENDTEATLTLSNGGVVVQAGETTTLIIVADINTAFNANGDEFAVELKEVVATSDVEGVDSLVANTMKVGGVDAATITIMDNSDPADVKAGDEEAEIVKFKIEGDTDSDVVVKSITLKGEGSIDEEDELANFKLLNDGEVLAETVSSNGKYVTFDLGDGFTVAEDKTEKFVVTADIMGGAAKTIEFKVDKTLDVTAEGTKYGYGAGVIIDAGAATFGSIDVEPGELTLADEDASNDKIRQDKKNVELGSIVVTNVAGKNLELQKFGIKAVLSAGTLVNTFENFEAVINGTSYELETTIAEGTTTTGVYTDTDLDITLPQGATTIVIQADTKDGLADGTTVDLSMGIALNETNTADADLTDGQFIVVETEDDNIVSDLTPSSLTFKKLTVIQAAASVARIPVANTTVVRGAKDTVAMMFEIEASEASDITVNEIKTIVTANTAAATNQEIAQVALYKDSVSDSNLLDRKSGSSLDAAGIATFDGFNLDIAADQKQTFVVTVDVVDGADAVTNSPVEVMLRGASMEDDDNDDIYFAGDVNTDGDLDVDLDSVVNITVTPSGTLAINADVNNTDNDDAKTILAGTDTVVFSVDVIADNEEVDVEKITFTVDKDLTSAVNSASLYLDDTLVATNSNSDITATTITFDNLSDLIIPEENTELKLQLNTAPIGDGNVGLEVLNVTVTNVEVLDVDAEGVDSGKTLGLGDVTTYITGTGDAKIFNIAGATVLASVSTSFNSSNTAVFDLNVDTGDNNQATTQTPPVVEVEELVFTEEGNIAATAYTLKDEDGNILAAGTDVGGEVVFTGLTISIEDVKTLKIEAEVVDAGTDTYGLTLKKDGIIYTVDGGASISNNSSDVVGFGAKQ